LNKVTNYGCKFSLPSALQLNSDNVSDSW